MEERAYGVLRGKLGKIKRSNVDPAWLADELLAAKIIGNTDVQRASSPQGLASERMGELIGKVMGNGAPDVFQTFVAILFKEDHVKWLGKELKADFINAGGVWRKELTPPLQSEATGDHSEEGEGSLPTHSPGATASKQQNEDAGYSSLQVNSELLTRTIDPQDVLMSMFSHKLISLEEMEEINKTQTQSGEKRACEKMIYLLLKKWRSETYNRFLEVLKSCGYEECTVQLQKSYEAECQGVSSVFTKEKAGDFYEAARKALKKQPDVEDVLISDEKENEKETSNCPQKAKTPTKLPIVLPERYKCQLLRILRHESDTMARRFFDLTNHTITVLEKENTSVVKLKKYASRFLMAKTNSTPTLADVVQPADDVDDVFSNLETKHFLTFYNFKILKGIIRNVCKDNAKLEEELEEYNSHFKEYIKRRVCESSLYYGGEFTPEDACTPKEGCNLVLITDERWDHESSLNALLDLEKCVADIFEIKDFVFSLERIEGH